MNINLIAPLNQLGYGIAGLNVSLALDKLKTHVCLFPIGQVDVPEEYSDVIEGLRANTSDYNPHAPCLRIWHQDHLAEFVGKGLHVGFPFFELDRFSSRERHHLSHCDKVFVASNWAKDVVIQRIPHMNDKVYVVPLGVDRMIFNENVPVRTLQPDHTVFLNVGKWERRKGHDVLIAAFCKAFRPSDKVSLHMAAFNPFIGMGNDDWARTYLGSPMGRHITLLTRLTSQRLLSSVLAGADCGVFPARAEGWNLDLLEMMSMGKNVICTYNTGHIEFATEDNARLIQCDLMEPAEDGVWFHGQGDWCKMDLYQEEQLIHHMREIHRLKQSGQLAINKAGIKTATKFSWDNTAQQIIKGLEN